MSPSKMQMNLQHLSPQRLPANSRPRMSAPKIMLALLLALVAQATFASVDLVMVEKAERRMYLIAGDEIVRAYRIALGGTPKGHKQQEGDQRTPEGDYILDFKNEDSAFHRSMRISYPNNIDKMMAEQNGVSPGGLIMVHGQRNGQRWKPSIVQRFDWTEGCIALTNAEMDEFMDLVEVGTKIRINP